jgi:oxygen-independent coproporphyrinogen-3 oxidase
VRLAPRYDRPGPRYTSYPPAPHFTETLGAEAARDLYRSRDRRSPPLSLYVHLPFCEEMCTYCACNVIVSRNPAIVERYLATLTREVALVREALGGGSLRVVQLHLGGGTPTFFPPDALERLHALLAGTFEIDPAAELAIEVDPRVTTAEHVRTLARLGWRRVSMGIQDFDPVVQEEVHRVQPAEETVALAELCRREGLTSVNVDLMYGLPHQTLDGFRRTLDVVLGRIRPDRASMFGYAHVPWLKAHQRRIDETTLPGAAQRLAIFHEGLSRFVAEGYEFVGLDHFARPGDELALARREGTIRRNFMGFHTHAGTDMVAFGITAIGDVGGTYLQNQHRLSRWEEEVREGRLPVQKGYRRTPSDLRHGGIIQSLMCNGRAEARLTPQELAALAPLVEDGLVELGEGGLALTPLGRLFVRNVCLVFDEHLGKAPAGARRPRYSRTV